MFFSGLAVMLVLTVACAAPVSAPEKPEAIVIAFPSTNGSCRTTLCCSTCSAIPVVRIVDGDTFITSGNQSVRLFGIDTPEKGEKCYQEATERLKELAGSEVRSELGPRAKDRYDRLLYYVYTQDGRSIDEMLVTEGLAKAWPRDGQHRDLLVRAEGEAKGCLK